jgi:hypothetical protein
MPVNCSLRKTPLATRLPRPSLPQATANMQKMETYNASLSTCHVRQQWATAYVSHHLVSGSLSAVRRCLGARGRVLQGAALDYNSVHYRALMPANVRLTLPQLIFGNQISVIRTVAMDTRIPSVVTPARLLISPTSALAIQSISAKTQSDNRNLHLIYQKRPPACHI